MSSYRPTYAPDERNRPSPIDRSPNYGQQPGGQQPSFKTNVNRMKTKRWVNAKTYSYDGDDWGESDDDDEYDYQTSTDKQHHDHTQSLHQEPPRSVPEVPAVPKQHIGSSPPTQDNATSEGEVEPKSNLPINAPASTQQAGLGMRDSIFANEERDTAESKPLPFIRPADIYKRLAEEKEKERLQALSPATSLKSEVSGGTYSNDHTAPKDNNANSSNTGVPERVTQDLESLGGNKTADNTDLGNNVVKQHPTHPSNTVTEFEPESSSQLLQIKHMSVFGKDFMGQSFQDRPKLQETSGDLDNTTHEPNIPRNASLGFRSAVHQAFDAPDTPATTTGSIVRTDSEASTISPIIHPNTLTAVSNTDTASANQTPTIEEESTDQVQTPRQSQLLPENFKLGHRRSLTPPSTDSSPAKKPVVTANVVSPGSERADVAEATPAHSLQDVSPTHPNTSNKDHHASDVNEVSSDGNTSNPPRPSSSSSNNKELLGTSASVASEGEKRRSLNLTVHTGGVDVAANPANMPLPEPQGGTPYGKEPEVDTPMRPATSLNESNVNVSTYLPVAAEPRSRIRHESTLIPSAYDSYWSEQGEDEESLKPLPLRPASADRQPTTVKSEDIQFSAPAGADTASTTANTDNNTPSNTNSGTENHQVQRKFSWELETGASKPPQGPLPPLPGQTPSEQQVPQIDSASSSSAPDTAQQPLSGNNNGTRNDIQVSPQSSKPVSRADSPIAGDTDATKDANDIEVPATYHNSDAKTELLDANASGAAIPPSNPFENRSLKGFREIMQIEPRNKRIAAFDESREIFANGDLRFGAWVQHMADSHPEHAELIAKNGEPQGPVVQRATTSGKFPKLSSLGSISLPSSSSHHDSGGSPHTHTRHPSITPLGGMMNSQQVQAKGKDLLHSAGVFGGKAGGAAKGFFAKGRSKFRHSGSDKGSSVLLPDGPREPSMSRQDSNTRRRPGSSEGGSRSTEAGIPHVYPLDLDLEPLSVSMATLSPESLSPGSEANNIIPATPFKNPTPAPTPPLRGIEHQTHDSSERIPGMGKLLESLGENVGSEANVPNPNSGVGNTKTSVSGQKLSKETAYEEKPLPKEKDPSPSTDHVRAEVIEAEVKSATPPKSYHSGSDHRAGHCGSSFDRGQENGKDDSSNLPMQSNNSLDEFPAPADDGRSIEGNFNESSPVVAGDSHKSEGLGSLGSLLTTSLGRGSNGTFDKKKAYHEADKRDQESGNATRKHGSSKSVEKAQLSAFISSISPDGNSDSEEVMIYLSPSKSKSSDNENNTGTNNESRTPGSNSLHLSNNMELEESAGKPNVPGKITRSSNPDENTQAGNQTLSRKFSFESNNVTRMKGLPALPTTSGQAAPLTSYRHASLHNPHYSGHTTPSPDMIQRPHSAAQVRNPHHVRINSGNPNVSSSAHSMRQQPPTPPGAWDRQRAEATHIVSRLTRTPSFATEDEKSAGTHAAPKPLEANPQATREGVAKKRTRSNSTISGLMSKVSLGRSRDEGTAIGTQSGEKRSNFNFRSLRLDAKTARNKAPAVGRHSSLQTKPTEQQIQEQADGKGILSSARRRGSNLASSTEQEMKDGISKMRNIITRSSHAQNPALAPHRPPTGYTVASPAQKSGRLQTQSLPTTPLTNRAGRFYSSMNPKLHRVHEQVEPPHNREERGRPRASSQSAGPPLHRVYMAYNPAIASAGHNYNSPLPRQYSTTPVIPTPNFSPPSSVDGRAGDFARPPRRAHTADLHIRSRSPISYQPDAAISLEIAAADNNSKPVSQLGMFRSVTGDFSHGGGQQRPWEIALPHNDSGPGVGMSQYSSNVITAGTVDIPPPPPPKIPLHTNDAREPTPAPRTATTQPHAVELPAPNNNNNNALIQPVELPTHDDSSEEIVMSSTAYPGQEWQPAYLGHWD